MIEVRSFDSDKELTAQAAADVTALLKAAIALRGSAKLVLTGGTLGIQILRDFAAQNLDLADVEIFFGDERFVALDHADRNEAQGLAAWPGLNNARLHRFPNNGQPLDLAATFFNAKVSEMFGDLAAPGAVFDVVILGMGPDGHVASLFPGHTQPHAWVVAESNSPKPPAERLSFSYQALNRSRAVVFLASGTAKAAVAKCAINDSECDLPAAKVRGSELTRWYVDQEISREL